MNEVREILASPLFSSGDSQVTVGVIVAVIVVLFMTYVFAGIAGVVARRFMSSRHEEDIEAAKKFATIVKLFVWLVGIEIGLHLLGLRLTSLFAASGFLAIAGGLAVKETAESYLAGVTLRADKTIRPGDLIDLNGKWMYVQRIGLRNIEALTYEGEEVLIPNSHLTKSIVTNLTRNNRLYRLQVAVSVASDSDLDLVRKILEDSLDGLDWRSSAKSPGVFLENFKGSAVTFTADVWIDDVGESKSRRSDLVEAIWRALKEQGIRLA